MIICLYMIKCLCSYKHIQNYDTVIDGCLDCIVRLGKSLLMDWNRCGQNATLILGMRNWKVLKVTTFLYLFKNVAFFGNIPNLYSFFFTLNCTIPKN